MRPGKAVFICLYVYVLVSCKSKSADHHSDKSSTASTHPSSKTVIVFLPYKGFDRSLIGFLQKEATGFYHFNTTVLQETALPDFTYYKPRNRYKADSLLKYQNEIELLNKLAIVGLTDKDISTAKADNPDWGVFGLGFLSGDACVISTYRLQRASKTTALFQERLAKVVLHELGHNLGLPHCENDPACLMTDAGGTIAQVDREKKWICGSCTDKLRK